MFDDFEVFHYSLEQAIEDGDLVHPYPDKFPWLIISHGIHHDCKKQTSDDLRTYDQKLIPLMMDAVLVVRAADEPSFPMVLEHTVVGTVWIMPNEKRGLTLMKPSEY